MPEVTDTPAPTQLEGTVQVGDGAKLETPAVVGVGSLEREREVKHILRTTASDYKNENFHLNAGRHAINVPNMHAEGHPHTYNPQNTLI